jgi:arginyl-tRNA synthetase
VLQAKQEFAQLLHKKINNLNKEEVIRLIEKPKYAEHGDLAFPCFLLAKEWRKSPQHIAIELSSIIQSDLFSKVEVVGAYINVFLNKEYTGNEVIQRILVEQETYGSHHFGKGEIVTLDMSSPNIAKPFSMGHLRSTVIGNSLSLLLEKCGFTPYKINYIGDWGTQFGKLIAAYKLWGVREQVMRNPIKELLHLYVKFHLEAESNKELEQQGRDWFKRLEDGDEEALELWAWFREESLKEFHKIYSLLGITFDSEAGEAFYNDKMERIVHILEGKGLLIKSDEAKIVNLTEEKIPPCLIKKSDGATLYATRDLSAALYRKENLHFTKSLYVVGHEQSLHFKQVMAVLKKMGYEWADELAHIPFGMILKDGKKMSTRKGKVILLEDVLRQSVDMALQSIQDKNSTLSNKLEVARIVGVGAVIFHDLKHFRLNDVEFSLEDMLRYEGETGPYVQYTHARACSILRKGKWEDTFTGNKLDVTWEKEWPTVVLLQQFPEVIMHAYEKYDPSQIAKYVVDLAQAFNHYYAEVKILDGSSQDESRLKLVKAVTIVLKEGLRLLGLGAPEEM